MKTGIKLIGFDEEGRYEVDAILLAPGVAVMEDHGSFYFIRIAPSDEANYFVETETICDIAVMNGCAVNLADIPPESIAFAMWVAGKPVAVAV